MSRTISSVIAVSRNVIRLMDPKQPIPITPTSLLQSLNDTLAPAQTASFKTVWALSQDTPSKPLPLAELQALAISYIDDVMFLRDTMDKLHFSD
jgi:hypothetical protein